MIRILFPYYTGFYQGRKASVMTKEGDMRSPTVIAHEFAHVLGHGSEIEAEVLAYQIQKQSGEKLLQRSADMHRLSRQAWVTEITDLLDTNLRDEIKDEVRFSRQQNKHQSIMMYLTYHIGNLLFVRKQGAELSDYREGFTNFLYTAGIDI